MKESEPQNGTELEKKRKGPLEEQMVVKALRVDGSQNVKKRIKKVVDTKPNQELSGVHPWRNLQLILSLQNRDLGIQRKVKLVCDFVRSSPNEHCEKKGCETVSTAQLIIFLNSWIQSLLISSKKEVSISVDARLQSEAPVSCLDVHCWRILKFCLDESFKMRKSLNFSRDILWTFHYIAMDALSLLDKNPIHLQKSLFIGDGFELYTVALDCVSVIFTTHGGISNANLDLWIFSINGVIKGVDKIFANNLDGGSSCDFFMQFSCFLLDPFSKFLRVHPCRRNSLHDFVDKLLEPLLQLFPLMHHKPSSNSGWSLKLLDLVNEVLSYGLFHSFHVDGFLALHSTDKYITSNDGEQKGKETVIISYHRHLFDKLEKIIAGDKVVALEGIGGLLHLFIKQVKCHIRVSVLSHCSTKDKYSKDADVDSVSAKKCSNSSLTEETRKGVFEFFVKVMEPLLQKINCYHLAELEVEPILSVVYSTLKSINKLLASCLNENVYMRMEDTLDKARQYFMVMAFDTIMSFSIKIIQLRLSSDIDKKMIRMICMEVIVAMRYFIEIEYEVVGNDLVSLWLMILSHLDTVNQPECSLILEILDLGCQLIELYSELRQVNNIIFSLSKAIRLLVLYDSDDEQKYSKFFFQYASSSSSCEAYIKSVGELLSANKFKVSMSRAIKSIPEGQVGGCIHQLTEEVLGSLELLKMHLSVVHEKESILEFDLRTELIGRVLSEIYTLVLDSLTVTTGSSNSVRVSLEGLVTVIRPTMSCLVNVDLNELVFSVMGRASMIVCDKMKFRPSTSWLVLFLFRLYMSCRSLYRIVMSLVPPNVSKKMSFVMGDFSTEHHGSNLMERSEGYFFWITQPSVLLSTVIQSICENYLQDSSIDFSPLIYVLLSMAIQRLVDLNRYIKSFNFFLQKNDQLENLDDANVLLSESKRLRIYISDFETEAADLTCFMMKYFDLITQAKLTVSANDLNHTENRSWYLSICSVDEKALPVAIWWIICHTIDVWCIHAAKKKLKKFISLIIETYIFYSIMGFENESYYQGKIVIYNISMELLRGTDSVFYEQKFTRRYFASRFCRILKKAISHIFYSSLFEDIDTDLMPDWQKVINEVEEKISSSHTKFHKKPFKKQTSFTEISQSIMTSQSLLSLICWIPKEFLSSGSFSCYATLLLNLEWGVFRILLDPLLMKNHYELLKLFVFCRSALNHLMMALGDKEIENGKFVLTPLFCRGPLLPLWLLKSVYFIVELSFKNSNTEVNNLIFSLMDNTSYLFMTLSKTCTGLGVHCLTNLDKPCKELHLGDQSGSVELKSFLDSPGDIDACRSMWLVAKTLMEQLNLLLLPLKMSPVCCDAGHLKHMSSTVSCIQYFLWGLVTNIKQLEFKNVDHKERICIWKHELFSELFRYIDVFTDSMNFLSCMFFFQDSKCPEILKDFHIHPREERKNPYFSILSEFDSFGLPTINRSFLQSLVKGEHPEVAVLIGQLFVASSALLRLRLLANSSPFSLRLVPTFVVVSQFLLLKMSETVNVASSSFVLLEGVVKFLEELGGHFHLTNPTTSINMYGKLIDLHLRAIGRCISLQRRGATIVYHNETESNSSKPLPHGEIWLDEFKSRLKRSFTEFIKKPSQMHLLCVIQALERTLNGVQEGFTMVYQINTGSASGGKVSSVVSAAIECLDLIIEFVSGKHRLEVVKQHIYDLTNGLFNIILHLHSPQMFYQKLHNNAGTDIDSGYVILMSVEVLARVFGRHDSYKSGLSHLAQCLNVPAMLFRDFQRLRHPKPFASYDSLMSCSNNDQKSTSEVSYIVDQCFFLDLYAASCRLLYSVLRRHGSKCEQYIALFEDSVCVLLYCLESEKPVSGNPNGDNASWELPAIKCASFLRGIYEEIRKQKEVLGRHSFKLLCSYIWIYCGHGPLQTGIKREVDDGMRAGVYALIDACSADDLQHLHTRFGEGPCRDALAALRHDYKLNFQYQGKV